MTEYIIICLVAMIGSCLTLFSGFGLGTLLVPVFALFFPIDLSIALTAIVHFLNNVFKLILFGRHADKAIVIRFGLPSILAAFIGAYLLTFIGGLEPIFQYELFGKMISIMPIKVTIAIVLLFFALFEIIPKLSQLQFDKKYLPLGGLLSGFFGGLSGNQGALRSAFLIRTKLSKETFIATGIVIACLIDVSRLAIYSGQILKVGDGLNKSLIIAATLAAFTGAYFGSKLFKKVTINTLQKIVAFMLILFSFLLGFGII